MLSFEKHLQHYWDRVEKKSTEECWPWTGAKTWKGYGFFRWDGKSQNAHRVAWMLANGPIPEGIHCLHRCDNPACQNPAHLFLGTNLENISDKMSKGRHRGPRGERSSSAKLTSEQIYEIRERGETCEPYETIARRFGITEGHVSMIITRRSWKHLPERRMAERDNGR